MNYPRMCRVSMIAIISLGGLVAYPGCSKSDAGGSGSATASAGAGGAGDSSAGAASANPIVVEGDPDAAKAVQTKLEKTWLATPDGWISEYAAPVNRETSSPATAGDIFWEFKELKLKINTDQLTDIGKQTYGFRGACEITSFASRYFFCALDGSNGAGKWTEWSSVDPKVYFVETQEKGQWKMQGGYDHNLGSILKASTSDVTLWSGKKPDESSLSSMGKSNPTPAGSAGGSETAAYPNTIPGTGDPDAVKAVQMELKKHWIGTSGGWISALRYYPNRPYTHAVPFDELQFLEIKQMSFDVSPVDISDADKLNGIQYHGDCKFADSPARVFNSPADFRGSAPPRWNQWKDDHDSLYSLDILKINGQWQVKAAGEMASGTVPDAEALARLK